MSTSYVYGTGRRKEAVARVRLMPGDGAIVVNGKTLPSTSAERRRWLRCASRSG